MKKDSKKAVKPNQRQKRPQGKRPQDSMSNEEMRREHRAARQSQQKKRRRIFYVTLCIVLVIIGVVLSLTVFFNAKSISVEGDNFYTKEEIISASGIHTGDNLILLDKEETERIIAEKLPFIGSVDFSTSFPDKLTITVHKTEVKCALEYNKNLVLINEAGKVLGTVTSIDELNKNSINTQQIKKYSTSEPTTTKPSETIKPTETKKATEKTTAKSKAVSTAMSVATTKTVAKATTTSTAPAANAAPVTTQAGPQETPKKYILGKEKTILLKGVKVKSAVVGKHLETANQKVFSLYKEIMSYLEKYKVSGITEMNLSSTVNVTMTYQDRIKLMVGTVTNLDDKLALAAKVIKNQDEVSPYQKGTIDLTIDKKAYFTPETETTTPATTVPAETTTAPNTETTKAGETTTKSTTTTTKAVATTKSST